MTDTHKGISCRTAITLAIGVFMVVAVLPPRAAWATEEDAAQPVYSDVSSDGTHSANIRQLAAVGILEGTDCGDDQFCPWAEIPRWMMAVWIVRMVDAADPEPFADNETTRFEDVDKDEWWAPFVERLAELEITVGCSTTKFCPDQSTPRGQVASFLARAYKLPRGRASRVRGRTGRQCASRQY